jgi:hypothetical protein
VKVAGIPSGVWTALTGGLAGAALTLLVNWVREKRTRKSARRAQLRALTNEVHYARWLIEYNHQRIGDNRLPHKGLATIPTSNAEKVLFSSDVLLPLSGQIMDRLRDYIQQVAYHNNLIRDYSILMTLPPPFGSTQSDRAGHCLVELGRICTSDATYRAGDAEPSLLARAERLLKDLETVRIGW